MGYSVFSNQVSVDRKRGTVGIKGPLLNRLAVGAHQSDLALDQIVCPIEVESCAFIGKPIVIGAPVLGKSRTDQHGRARTNLHALRLGAMIKILSGNSITVGEHLDAMVGGDIKQHTAQNDRRKV